MKVNFTETVLRDANQSLIATRMPFSDFEGILESLDNAGYYSLECWGGGLLIPACVISAKTLGSGFEKSRAR